MLDHLLECGIFTDRNVSNEFIQIFNHFEMMSSVNGNFIVQQSKVSFGIVCKFYLPVASVPNKIL